MSFSTKILPIMQAFTVLGTKFSYFLLEFELINFCDPKICKIDYAPKEQKRSGPDRDLDPIFGQRLGSGFESKILGSCSSLKI